MPTGVAPEASVGKSNGKMHTEEGAAVTETGGEAEAESSLPFTPITLVCQVCFRATGATSRQVLLRARQNICRLEAGSKVGTTDLGGASRAQPIVRLLAWHTLQVCSNRAAALAWSRVS